MARIIRELPKYVTEIYVLIQKESGDFYVGKVRNPNHIQAFRNHAYGRNKQTCEWFLGLKSEGKSPDMYLLEAVEADVH